MTVCTATCPTVGVPCANRDHAPEVAHHASGVAPDGTHWSLFWWHPGHGEPGRSTERAGLAGTEQG
jgi:hypothetical protein